MNTYTEFLNQVKDMETQREGDYKNMLIQQFIFDIDSALKDGDITHEQRDELFALA